MLVFGVPHDVYWYGDIGDIKPYVKAYEIQNREMSSRSDMQAWLNGLYVHQALSVTLPKLFRNTGSKYPSKPLIAEKVLKKPDRNQNKPLTGDALLQEQKNFEAMFLAMAGRANRARKGLAPEVIKVPKDK